MVTLTIHMNPEHQPEAPQETPPVQIEWRKQFPTSTLTAAQINGTTIIGGSDWNRQTTPKSEQNPQKEKGVLTIVNDDGDEKRFELPSRLQVILPFDGNKVFYGCRGGEFYIVEHFDGRDHVNSGTSPHGGIYSAIYDPKMGKLLCGTFNGKLVTLNPKNGLCEASSTLSNCRLTTILIPEKERRIIAGDFEGIIHTPVTARPKHNLKNAKGATPEKTPNKKPLGPSIAGILEMTDGKMIIGTRWQQLFITSKNFNVEEIIDLPEPVTSMAMLKDDTIIIGTRSGNLLTCDLRAPTLNFKLVAHEKPSEKQTENSVHSITKQGDTVLASFADGIVYKMKIT